MKENEGVEEGKMEEYRRCMEGENRERRNRNNEVKWNNIGIDKTTLNYPNYNNTFVVCIK